MPPINVTKTERVDDIPLLIAQMEKMQIADLMDKHFPVHGTPLRWWGKTVEWDEHRSVIHSFKYAEAQERALEARLKKAEKAIAALNGRGQVLSAWMRSNCVMP